MRAEQHGRPESTRSRWLTKKRLAVGGVVTTAAMVSAFAGLGSAATADERPTDAESAAHAHMLWLEGIGLDVAGAGVTETEFAGTAVTDDSELDVSLLEGLVDLNLGNINLPLIKPGEDDAGLLHLGALGVAGSHSESSSPTQSLAATGLLTEEGALDVDAYDGGVGDPAYVDLTALIEQVLGDGALDELLSEARIEVGAVGSQIEKNGADLTSSYRIADLNLDLTSPLVGDVTTLVDDIVGGVVDPLNDAIGPDGSLSGIVNTLVSALNLNVPVVGGLTTTLETPLSLDVSSLTDSVREGLLQNPLDNSDPEAGEEATVWIDLNNGSIGVDLGGLLLASNDDFTDLNDLPANTDVLSGNVVNAITEGVLSALTGTGPNSLTSKAVDLVEDGLYGIGVALELNLNVSLLGIPAVDTTLSLLDDEGGPATLGGILGADGYTPAGLEIADEGVLGGLLTPVLGFVTTALDDLTSGLGAIVEGAAGEDGILDTLQPTVNGILNPIVNALVGADGDGGALSDLLNGVANLTINEQPEVGDLGEGSSTVRALSVVLLPGVLGDAAVKAELASSSVRAVDEKVYETAITVDPGTIEPGEGTTINGTGFEPNENVSVTLDGEEIGPIQADENGEFALPYTSDDDAAEDVYDVVATGDISQTPAEGELTIEVVDTGADPEADTNANVDADPDTAADPDSSSNVDADADPEADANVDGDPDSAADPDSSSNVDADADPEADANVDGDPDTAADPDSSSNVDADADPEADANVDGDPDSAADPDSSTDADSAADPEADANVDADADADADPEADSSSDGADATSDVNVDADADADGANADENTNASSSASASANADDNSNASAQAAAQAAAQADASTSATAAADADATAAAQSAANEDASSDASADVSSEANASSQAAAQAAAQADASSTSNADSTSAAEGNASAASAAASNADSSSDASAAAAANADGDADGANADENTNASSSASASANADDDSNASAQAAAQAAAQADASTSASAAADADATAAAQSAANEDASSDASADVSSEANASSQAAAQAAAQADASSTSNADSTSAAEGNASAASAAASNADSSSDASAAAAANADADGDADGAQISMDLENDRLQVGEEQVAYGYGFEPGETVTATQFSDPYAIGEQVADDSGEVTFTWNVPAGTNDGNHLVELSGETSGSVDQSFEVYSGGDLSPTGGDLALTFGGIAAAMLLAGAGVWFAVRRRADA